MAFEYFQRNFAETEASYPYVGVNGSCTYDATKATGTLVTDWTTVTPRDY